MRLHHHLHALLGAVGRGVGRAQGGYDEMVFRAMVRDSTYFYDPNQGVPNAILVYHEGDQLTWTGEVYDSFEAALIEHAGMKLVNHEDQ